MFVLLFQLAHARYPPRRLVTKISIECAKRKYANMSAPPFDHSAAGDATEVELQQMNKLVDDSHSSCCGGREYLCF